VGLKLRVNLFRDVDADATFHSLFRFYRAHGFDVRDGGGSDPYECCQVHEQDNRWVLVDLPMAWRQWNLWRDAQLHVSSELACAGFLVFVYDGDYWGYEFFRNGQSLDQFVQVDDCCDGADWFPGRDITGNPRLLADELPQLSQEVLISYLVRDPLWASWEGIPDDDFDGERQRRWSELKRLDVVVREGDEFTRFHECAALNFVRYLGVSVTLEHHYVTWKSPVRRSFRLPRLPVTAGRR
jgi:hypothetical protein